MNIFKIQNNNNTLKPSFISFVSSAFVGFEYGIDGNARVSYGNDKSYPIVSPVKLDPEIQEMWDEFKTAVVDNS